MILEGCRGYTPQYVVVSSMSWASKKKNPYNGMNDAHLAVSTFQGLILFSIEFFLAQHFAATKKRPTPFCIFLGETRHFNAFATQEMEREDEDGLMKAGPGS